VTDRAPTSPASQHEDEVVLWRNRAVEFWSDAVAAGQELEEARLEIERLQGQTARLRGRLRTAQEERRRLRERVKRLEARGSAEPGPQASRAADRSGRGVLARLRAVVRGS
jgi:chromosome segregation ATPase